MFAFGGCRKLRFAGSWYSSSAELLGTQLDEFAESARGALQEFASVINGHENILAIVAPHAGYMYSGATAGISYQAVANRGYKRVFMLGPSHSVLFTGAALSGSKTFATVFGDLAVDTEVVEDLKQSILFQERNDVHAREHSLELQLAFIRRVLGKVAIVPILLGKVDLHEAHFIGRKLLDYLESDDLVVVSSDFTHIGPRYGYNPFSVADQRLHDLDMEAFSQLSGDQADHLLEFYKRTGDTICGIYALTVLLTMLPEASKPVLLKYITSRQIVEQDEQKKNRRPDADEIENSVSYMAIAYPHVGNWHDVKVARSEAELVKSQSETVFLSENDQRMLVYFAEQALSNYVRSGKGATETARQLFEGDSALPLSEMLRAPAGVFVTLYKGADKTLRGCIGTIIAIQPLYLAVIENVIAAASRDPRFAPVASSELSSLTIELNVLTVPTPVASAQQIRLGIDGIIFYHGDRQAVFLPAVATEQGWNLEQTLSQLASKAGLDQNAWKRNSRFEIFQSLVIH